MRAAPNRTTSTITVVGGLATEDYRTLSVGYPGVQYINLSVFADMSAIRNPVAGSERRTDPKLQHINSFWHGFPDKSLRALNTGCPTKASHPFLASTVSPLGKVAIGADGR